MILERWLKEYPFSDFRTAVTAHANFLYCQAAQVDRKYQKQPFWAEIDSKGLNAVAEQIERAVAPDMLVRADIRGEIVLKRKTTVTPYVYECFAHLPWARFL